VSVTCVRVPGRVSHSEAIQRRIREPISVEQARDALSRAPGVVLMDEAKGRCRSRCSRGPDEVFVGRVRRDPKRGRTPELCVVADNPAQGRPASNAVQIAELLLRDTNLNHQNTRNTPEKRQKKYNGFPSPFTVYIRVFPWLNGFFVMRNIKIHAVLRRTTFAGADATGHAPCKRRMEAAIAWTGDRTRSL